MKELIEFFDKDFLDNKIEIGDKVIIEEPKYRNFIIGTVVTKAPKSCQIEYVDFVGDTKIARQYYGQIIKYPIAKEGKWIFNTHQAPSEKSYFCSICAEGESDYGRDNYCPNCGANMRGKRNDFS